MPATKIKKQKARETILVWDDAERTFDLRLLLQKHLPKGFDLEESIGTLDDGTWCRVMRDYETAPVICDDPRTRDQEAWEKGAAQISLGGPAYLSNYGVVLARLTHRNIPFVFPRLLFTQQGKPDTALFLYSDDVPSLKKPLEERFRWMSRRIRALVNSGSIYTKEKVVDMIEEGTLFTEIAEHQRRYRVLIVDAPVAAARYEGLFLSAGTRVPSTSHSTEDALERIAGYGLALVNSALLKRTRWDAFTHKIREVAPRTVVAFYTGDGWQYPQCFEQEEAGVEALVVDGDVMKSIQYGILEDLARKEEEKLRKKEPMSK